MEPKQQFKISKEYKNLTISVFVLYTITIMLPILMLPASALMIVAVGLVISKFGILKGIYLCFVVLLMNFLTSLLSAIMAVGIYLPNMLFIVVCGFGYGIIANKKLLFINKSLIITGCVLVSVIIAVYNFIEVVDVEALQKLIISGYDVFKTTFSQAYGTTIEPEMVSSFVNVAIQQLMFIFPTIVVVASGIMGMSICYIGTFVSIKIFKDHASMPDLSVFKLKRLAFFGLIMSLIFYMFSSNNVVLNIVTANMFFILFAISIFNGLGFIDYFFKKPVKLPIVRYIIYCIVLIIPFVGYIIGAIGSIESLTKFRTTKVA